MLKFYAIRFFEEYEMMVLVENTNRDDNVVEARSLDEAIAKIVVTDNLPVDKHPEKSDMKNLIGEAIFRICQKNFSTTVIVDLLEVQLLKLWDLSAATLPTNNT